MGILISLVLLWWTLHDIALHDVIAEVRRAKPALFFAGVAVATLTFPLRTARWRYLLRLEGESIPFAPLWHATAIGFMANNLLPARAGEFARAYAAGKLTGVRFSTALASLAVERIMDGVAMVALMTIAIVSGGFALETKIAGLSVAQLAGSMAIIFATALTVAVAIVNWPVPALRTAKTLFTRIFPPALAVRAMTFTEGLVAGLDALRSPPRFFAVVGWSLAIWCTYAASFWLCFEAFSIDVP